VINIIRNESGGLLEESDEPSSVSNPDIHLEGLRKNQEILQPISQVFGRI
jgi:hypothetical protein